MDQKKKMPPIHNVSATEKKSAIATKIQETDELFEYSPVDAPMYSVSGVHIQGTSNDFLMSFTRIRPVKKIDGSLAEVVMSEVSVVVTMSPQSAKDISIALNESIKRHEMTSGEITTPYSQRANGKNS